jgi:transcription elongation factor
MKYLFIAGRLTPTQFDQFLQLASEYCTSFSLVWRKSFRFNENAKQIENDLKKYLIKEEITSKWPGTEIIKAKATVRHYKLNENSKKILR